MIQYSFLIESKKHLKKILSRYTPEQARKITSRLVTIGKEGGGLHSPTEYGRRMYNGQIKRLQNIAKKNRINLVTNDGISDSIQSGIIMKNGGAQVNIPSMNLKPTEFNDNLVKFITSKQFKTNKNYRRKIRNFNKNYVKSEINLPLNNSNIVAHEADELSLALKHMKDNNLTATDMYNINRELQKNSTGVHNIDVLKRENIRQQILNMLYGKGLTQQIPRSKAEYKLNKRKINPLILLYKNQKHLDNIS